MTYNQVREILTPCNSKILRTILCISFGLLILSSVLSSCQSDDIPAPEKESVTIPQTTPAVPKVDLPIFKGETGQVWIYDSTNMDSGYILVNDATANRVYLMNKEAKLVYEWELPSGIGNDAELLEDGRLLVSLQAKDAVYDIGGYGGRIQIINPDRTVDWDFTYSSKGYISHHDIEMLPNGNVLVMAWHKKNKEEAEQAGYDGSPINEVLLPESLIEINPENDEIIWEWHSWDHLVQDFDETKENFGVVSENPQLLDINYKDDDRGDIMHANGLDYDPINDLIYLSINFYSEVWVIDHSTNKEEASTNKGGNYGKGGNLVYRFGNPSAYKSEVGGRLFYSNHFPNILKFDEIGAGNMLIYMNGNNGPEQSRVYELAIPKSFDLESDSFIQPLILWEFTDSELYSPIVSGAVRLPNGNTLITEGSYGFWEVTPEGKVVWKFEGAGLFWRGYSYPKNHAAIELLQLH